MAVDEALVAWVEEALASIGPVTRRAMMGGATLYCGGTVFAIVALDALWFKADAVSDAKWDAAGAARFTYERDGGVATMNYRRAPDDVYDDSDALRRWGSLGLEAGRRAPAKSRRQSARPTVWDRPRRSAGRVSDARPRASVRRGA